MDERSDDLTILHGQQRTGAGYRAGIDHAFCYITTTGRRTGRPHRIEIWFAAAPGGQTIYVLAGGRDRADFVRNALVDPRVTVRIGDREGDATARVIEADSDEDALARRLVLTKYASTDDLGRLGRHCAAGGLRPRTVGPASDAGSA